MNDPQYDSYSYATPPQQKSGKGWLVVLIILGSILGLGCLCCGGGGLWMYFAAQEPDDITLNLTVPSQCSVGDTITLRIEVINTAAKPRELKDIDVATTYLDGFVLVSANPTYGNTYDMLGMRTMEFNQTIAANATYVVELELEAVTPGNWSGGVDVSVDNIMSFKSQIAQTNVTP